MLANAERAIAELRAQIWLQVEAIGSLDTKAVALAALSVTVLAFVASRILRKRSLSWPWLLLGRSSRC